MERVLESFNQSEAFNAYHEQNVKPILEFSIDRFLRNGPFNEFCFIHTNDMEDDITLEDNRNEISVEGAAYVTPNGGAIQDRGLYQRDMRLVGKSRMGTYNISNAISWDILGKNPVSIADALETLLVGFKQKVYTDLTDVLAMAAQGNQKRSLKVLLKSINRKSGRSVDYLYYDCDIEDDKERFLGDTKGYTYRVIETGLQKSINKTKLQYDDSGRKPIIAVALHPEDKRHGISAIETPFVVAQRGLGQIFLDTSLHRSGKLGLYGWANVGFACHASESVGIAYVKDE